MLIRTRAQWPQTAVPDDNAQKSVVRQRHAASQLRTIVQQGGIALSILTKYGVDPWHRKFSRMKFALAILSLAYSWDAAFAASVAPPDCGLSKVQTLGELNVILSMRALEAVRLAAKPSPISDRRLTQLVAPSANFSLGGGDVVFPMGSGVGGLRAFTKDMRPASFRYYGWDGIPTPVENACTMQHVAIEFIDVTAHAAFPVTFTFEAGRMVAAAGWRRSLTIGKIDYGRN